MKILQSIFFFALICTLSCYSSSHLYKLHSENRDKTISHFNMLPSGIAKAITLEFSGIISDHLMLKTLTYMGERIIKNEKHTSGEWQIIYQALVQITNLDPRFFDAYLVAAMTLPWDAGMVKETNTLLEKAGTVLTDDYRPYFFLWYNYLNFLNDQERAGYYLEKAARKPGAPVYFKTLAARMKLFAGKTYAGIIFLQEMIQQTNDPAQLQYLKIRLQALQKIGFLEQKINLFKERYQTAPHNLQELIEKGLMSKIPKDPYGGKFYIMTDGRVYTTSKLIPQKIKK